MHFVYDRGTKFVFMMYSIIFLIVYGVFPIIFTTSTGLSQSHAYHLSSLTILSILFVFFGIFFHSGINFKKYFLKLSYTNVSLLIFCVFIGFVILCLLTAEKIPIVASLQGEDATSLANSREMFLKARTGWQSSFVYINALLGGAIVPYIICVGFERKSNLRFIYFFIFLVYSISFLEKAFFLKIAIPLFFLFYTQKKNKLIYAIVSIAIVFTLLVFMFIISGGSELVTDNENSFFSAYYRSRSPLEQVIWRSIVIPVVTSIDAIRLFFENYDGSYLMGATNSTMSFIFNQSRIEFEREVFNLQWGQNEFGTGSANSVYITEAFVNFGWIGVALFAFLIGRILYLFMRSSQISIKAISFLFIYGIFNSGLLSNLLSNGYLLMLIIALYIRWED